MSALLKSIEVYCNSTCIVEEFWAENVKEWEVAVILWVVVARRHIENVQGNIFTIVDCLQPKVWSFKDEPKI